MDKAKFHIPSVSCSSCAGKIQDELRSIKGIGGVSIDLKSQVAEVEYDPGELNAGDIRDRIASLGYDVAD